MAVQPETLDAYDDRELVAAFQAGEEDAFERIVGLHYASLLAEARRRLRTVGDAEDAVQETLLRAYLALDRFGGEFHLRAWLGRILSNACADAATRRAGELRLFGRLAGRRDLVPPADDNVGSEEVRKVVKKAVEALPEAYQMAFVLREVEERSYAEVAERMSVTEPNARARVHRAKSVLQQTLRGTGATLGGFLIPVRLWAPRWLSHGRLSRQSSGNTPSVGVGPRPAGTFSSVSQAPLSQAFAQAASGPVAQTIVTVAPEVSRSALPVAAGALATLAAAGAAVVVPAAVNLAPPPQAPAPHVAVASPSNSLAWQAPASPSDTTGPAAATTTTAASAVTPVIHTSTISPWSWVNDAAGLSVAAAAGSATDQTGASNPTTSASPAAGTPAGPVCPYLQSFPTATPPGVSLPPAIAGGAGATVFFSTGTISVPNAGPSFESTGTGTASDSEDGSGQQSVVSAVFGACMPSTSTPALIANLVETDNPASNTLQLRGALVTATTADGETDALYRGVAVWLSGPDSTATPVPFVGEVALQQQAGLAVLRVAFFGTEDALLAPIPTSSGGAAPVGSNGTSSGQPSSQAPTSSSPAPTGTSSPGGTGSGSNSPADPGSSDPTQPGATQSPSSGDQGSSTTQLHLTIHTA